MNAANPLAHHVTLRQLRVFLSVAEGGNFSRAGEGIGLTQPAVSRSIVELESQLGVRLLDRTTREVSLTAAGQSLAASATRILEELDQALLEVSGLAAARVGKVRVASSPTLSAHLMPACIAACALEAPDIRFMLLDRIQQDVLASVRSGEVDFGVVVEPPSPDDLYCETILADPFVLVLLESNPLARKKSAKPVKWAELDGEPLVLLDHASGSRRLIDDALAAHGATCEVHQELGHPTTVFRMVEAGIGISVMPALSVPQSGFAALTSRPLVPTLKRDIMLVRRRNRALSPLADYVWNLIRMQFLKPKREVVLL
ncbi:MAG: LysR family transcriptional regulator [Comamonadaceae bacterium]|nr:MAG: LysR family transcriptional regulator [Comamonadaceae bacterium]